MEIYKRGFWIQILNVLVLAFGDYGLREVSLRNGSSITILSLLQRWIEYNYLDISIVVLRIITSRSNATGSQGINLYNAITKLNLDFTDLHLYS